MAENDIRAEAFSIAEKLLGIAIDIVGDAKLEVTENTKRDPKLMALALLCRAITNFRGAMVLAREDQVVESRVLTRCCYENLLWIGALRERGADFIQDMVNDETANKRALGELTLKLTSKAGAKIDDEIAMKLRGHLRYLDKQFPNSKKLHVNEAAAQGVVELAYIEYGRLSLDSAHPSISALRRHIRWVQENNENILTLDIVPPTPPNELIGTVRSACEAILGVSIATNELLGGTRLNEALQSISNEFSEFKSKTASTQTQAST